MCLLLICLPTTTTALRRRQAQAAGRTDHTLYITGVRAPARQCSVGTRTDNTGQVTLGDGKYFLMVQIFSECGVLG